MAAFLTQCRQPVHCLPAALHTDTLSCVWVAQARLGASRRSTPTWPTTTCLRICSRPGYAQGMGKAETLANVAYCWTWLGLCQGHPGCRRVRMRGLVTCRRGSAVTFVLTHPLLSRAVQALPPMSMVRLDFMFCLLARKSLPLALFVLFLPWGADSGVHRARGSGACRNFLAIPFSAHRCAY